MSSKGKILVVDDTPTNLEVISDILTDADYTVATAIDGERALKRLQTYVPDLILLDVQMPGIDGFETCQQIKSNPATASIPVIFITALADTDSKVHGLNLGAVDYITKPFQEAEMLARINTHLQLQHLRQHLEQCVAERTGELQMALEELRKSQLQLVQSEKMSALGNLIAGVAHEINNPVTFIAGNLEPAQDYIWDLLKLIHCYQTEQPCPSVALQDLIETIDLDYLQDDLPRLISSMQEGVNRIRNISVSLRTFSRADSDRPVPFNLHEGLDSTLLILKHRLKASDTRPEITTIAQYGQIPLIHCFAGQLNQVFMNILANAIDAIEEFNQGRSFAEIQAHPNQIIIQTEALENHVMIRISDNGIGIPEALKNQIFDQGFTTKAVGKGTGLGLAIARQIVEEKHGGTIVCTSELGKGTQFEITLPLGLG